MFGPIEALLSSDEFDEYGWVRIKAARWKAMRVAPTLVVCILLCVTDGVSAQERAFEIASIRPNVSGGESTIRPMPNGRFIATNVSLRSLILRAYGLHHSQLIGAPAWIDVERFDIDARAESAPAEGPEALIPMLRVLLAERFRLRVRPETRELPVYVLVLARQDGRLGPQIRPTQVDCSAAGLVTESQILAFTEDGWPFCGMGHVRSSVTMSDAGPTISGRIRRSAIEMQDLARTFQGDVDRPVVERTGLEGRFDVEYWYVMRQPPNRTGQPADPSDAPTLFVALDEQLGLKLESQRREVPVLVVDAVERPSEN